jgi:hypothetical protein
MVDLGLTQQIVDIITGAATIAVVFLLWRTVQEMRETSKVSTVQLNLRFRPWVGPSSGIEFLRTNDGKDQFAIRLKNFGESPATSVIAISAIKTELPTRDVLKASDSITTFNLGPLLPNMEKRYWLFIDSDLMKKAKEGNGQIYIALYFSYEFIGGRSGYGLISHFDKQENMFVHRDMWVD